MKSSAAVDRPRKFIPALEGIRGYGVLCVFFGHYFDRGYFDFRRTHWLYPLFVFRELAWVMVPAFFALSGFLICSILIDTRDKEGYFRVFYQRRILRIFPIYYITLLVIAALDMLNGFPLSGTFWTHFTYLQNILPGYRRLPMWSPANQTIHMWSLGVEEQFYMAWPLVVWLCRDKRTLLRVTWAIIAGCSVLRFAAPLLHMTPWQVYYSTFTRVDAILLGCILAIIRGDAIYERLERYAGVATIAGFGSLAVIAVATGGASPSGYIRCACLIPLGNFTAAAFVMSVKNSGSLLSRACGKQWICWVGSRSYSMYLFHFAYMAWFETVLEPRIQNFFHLRYYPALMLAIGAAFVLTLVLGDLSYRFVEKPSMNAKNRVKYGAAPAANAPAEIRKPALAESDT